ncbi:hypothetical protein LCGC14_1326930, partial [marine sediment metagenome]
MRIKNTIKGMSLAKYKKKYFDCMAPDCEGIQKDRGLCPIHLKLFQENIDKKVLPDWSVIEKEGHCMAPGVPEELWDKRGRKSPPLDCRTKDCGNKAKSRGLCVNCYQVAYRFVQRRKTTWEELEERDITTSSYNKRKPEVTTALHKLIEADSGPLEEADRHLGRKPPATEVTGYHTMPVIEGEDPPRFNHEGNEVSKTAAAFIPQPTPSWAEPAGSEPETIDEEHPSVTSEITQPGVHTMPIVTREERGETFVEFRPRGTPSLIPDRDEPSADDQEAIQKRMSKAFEKFVFEPPIIKEQGEEELRNMRDAADKALAEHIFEPPVESTDAANEPDSEELQEMTPAKACSSFLGWAGQPPAEEPEGSLPITFKGIPLLYEPELGQGNETLIGPKRCEPDAEVFVPPAEEEQPKEPTLDWMKDSKLGEDTILTGDLDKLGG